MKPHGKGRWESLYFDYPEFEAPARDGLAMRAPVTICLLYTSDAADE